MVDPDEEVFLAARWERWVATPPSVGCGGPGDLTRRSVASEHRTLLMRALLAAAGYVALGAVVGGCTAGLCAGLYGVGEWWVARRRAARRGEVWRER